MSSVSLLDGERKAVHLIAEFLGEHDLDHSAAYHLRTASKIVANRSVFSAWFRDLEASSGRVVRQQQRRHEFGPVEALEEEVHGIEQELDVKRRMLADARAAQSPQLVDRDDARAQEDTDRQNLERASQRADAQAVRP